MDVIWGIAFGLIAMLAFSFANVTSKVLTGRLSAQGVLFSRGVATVFLLSLAAAPHLSDLQSHVGAAILTLLLGVAGYFPVLAFLHGLKQGRVGVIAPIAGTAPLFTVVLSFAVLSVPISFVGWIAILIVIGANVFVAVDFDDWKNSRLLNPSSGVPFALCAAVGWGLFFFFLIPSTRALGPWLSPVFTEIGVTAAAGVHLLLSDRRLPVRAIVRGDIILNGLCIAVAIVAFTVGVAYFDVGIVAALSNSHGLPSAILGAMLFHEHLQRREKLAGAAMVAGIFVLSLSA